MRWKRNKIEKVILCGRVLDIGCGTGEFLLEMKQHGWEVKGLEIDKKASEFAEKEYGLEVLNRDLNDLRPLENPFEVITMWHVLEHLHQPLNALKNIKDMLKDDGILVIAAPNIASFDAKFYRNNWIALDAPRHLQHFEPESLTSLCQAAGLEIFKCQQMPFDAFYNCLMSELLIISTNAKLRNLLPVFLVRAVFMALISLVRGSRLINNKFSYGSSNVYFIHKKGA